MQVADLALENCSMLSYSESLLIFLGIEIILSHYGRKGCTEGQAYVGAPLVTTT